MSLIERPTAVYNAIRNALGPYAPDITGTAFGEPILRNATAGAIAAMKPQLEAMQAEIDRLREALTPSGHTKAAYHGEFKFDVPLDGYDEDGEPLEGVKSVYVPWTTIKEIMAAILARASLDRQGK